MKLPALQFYPGDWKKDPGVRSLNLQERGAWIEILFLMHECEPRGYLMLNGKPMPAEALALQLGIGVDLVNQITTKLVDYGVMKVNPQNGSWYSKRMVNDEYIREIRKNCGKMGGNPHLVNQKPTKRPTKSQPSAQPKANQAPNQKPTPSVSVSVSTERININTAMAEFDNTIMWPEISPDPPPAKSKPKDILEMKIFCLEIGCAEIDAEYLWNHWEDNGWKRNGEPIRNWKLAIHAWKAAGHLPSMKKSNSKNGKQPPQPKVAF